ncbi:MAG: hypothetical protein HGB17_10130, partial [Syntrophobacteraceae bacterium]|nr:hypothetical protein [Syntrophobacteraceae bacterium]
MRIKVILFLLLLVFARPPLPGFGADWIDFPAALIRNIPPRPWAALTGSEFARSILRMDGTQREQAILDQCLAGKIPDFLRRLRPIFLSHQFENGKSFTAALSAMPDYLAIGSDRDFLRIPMNLYTAMEIAKRYGFFLPTRKIVDAIFSQSAFRLSPQPMPPGPRMRSTAYYLEHNQRIRKQRLALGFRLGELVAGHKKDVVMTSRLVPEKGKIAIYGWHRPSGVPIQPLSTIHNAFYADYSHGIRLVSEIILINDEPRSLYDVLEDPRLASVVSDEGAMPGVRQFM